MIAALLMVVFLVLVVAITLIAIIWVRARAARKTAASRHASLQGIAREAPPGSKLTALEPGATTWVEIGSTSEVPNSRGGR